MATIRLVPSTLANANTQLTITGETNAFTNTDSSTYATIVNTTASTSNRYIYLRGFNFDSVPANAVVSSFTVKIKGNYSNGYGATLYLCNGTTTQSNATASALGSSVATRTFSNGSLTWDSIKAMGENFGIRINCRRNSRNTQATYYIYGAEIEVTYTVPSTVAVTGVTLDKSTASVTVGATTTLTESVLPSNASNKSVTWSTSDSSVATVSGGVVTGVAAGSATITVTTVDGGYTDTCTVTVNSSGGATWETIFDSNDVYVSTASPNYIYIPDFNTPIEADTVYRVTWDGGTYTCTSQPYGNAWDGYALGNLSLDSAGSDTGEPFMVYRASWDGGANIVLLGATTTQGGQQIHVKIEKQTGGGSAPVITVGTPSRSIISDETGFDQCTCTFTADVDLTEWEARATKAGTTPARGVGLLVESGTTLAAGSTGTVVVDDEELTNGDGEYTITVYGKSSGGVWSE